MSQCQKKECNVAKKREKLISDFQELIDCIGKTEHPGGGQITVHKQLICVPCPDGDSSKNATSNACQDESWKKNRYKSRELKSGILYSGCDCLKRNGLQHDCQRSDCMGRPPCLLKPWPDCLPSGGTGLRGAEPKVSKYPYRPAPCPVPDLPPGYEQDLCHKAEVDCKKCTPVLMCRPGEVWECTEGKCPPNPPSNFTYLDAQTCPLGKMMQLPGCPLATQCPNKQERLPTNIIGQEIICHGDDKATRDLRERQRVIGCPNKGHQRPGYENPQVLCRPADPQPVQQILHSGCPMMGSNKHCDPPTHVLKRPAYPEQIKPPVSDDFYGVPPYCSKFCSEQSCPGRQVVPDKTLRPPPRFVPEVYRKPPRSTVDDWICQLPCEEKEPPMCVQCYGETCIWHQVPPLIIHSTNDDLFSQW